MRKLLYLFAVTVLVLASCNSTNKYKITGSVQGGYDGEKVYLMERVNRDFVNVDSAVIADGKFILEGTQPEPVNRYLAFTDGENDPLFVDFFLENGNIDIYLAESEENSTVKGTAINNSYQSFKDEMYQLQGKLMASYSALQGGTVAEEEREAKMKEIEDVQDEMTQVIKKYISGNSNSVLGAYLLSTNQYNFSYDEVDEFLTKIPENLQTDEGIVKMKENIQAYKNTAEGKKFVDFKLETPEGEAINLSDYAGTGKVVLVDFWASWCGPCVREMPRLVEMYEKYKNQGFEIVGVSLDSDGEAWKKGIERLNITWPQMSDLKGWQSEAAKMYAIRSIPHVLVLDKDGVIVSRGLHGEELQKKIEELMK